MFGAGSAEQGEGGRGLGAMSPLRPYFQKKKMIF